MRCPKYLTKRFYTQTLKLIGIITGTSVAASSFFVSCTDAYGPVPYKHTEEMERCCREAASFEKCVQRFEDKGDSAFEEFGVCQDNAQNAAE